MATAVKEAVQTGVIGERHKTASFDKGTIAGIFAAMTCISIAIYLEGDFLAFFHMTAALIVLGGSMSTTFMAFPAPKILSLIPVIVNAFKPDVHEPSEYIDEIVGLLNRYRNGGMKALETSEELLDNRFLKEGISLIVDGYNVREITELMERNMNSLVERHNYGQKILRFIGSQAPAFGMCGTLIGLIQLLLHLEDPSKLGPAMGVALVTTFYGITFANLIVSPLVSKLAARTEHEVMLIKAIKVGVIGIHDRLNPQKIIRNMNSLLPPSQQR